MKVLVTGAAGFIGYHCSLELMKQGHEVCGYDNCNDYYLTALKEARLARLQEAGLNRFERADLEDQTRMMNVFEQFRPDVVVHLAAQAGVRYSLSHPHAYAQANLIGTLNILEACRHNGNPRLVYASSSSVYGGNTKLPFAVEDSVDHPISLYAATKKANELMAHTYTHLYGQQTIGLRFFTVYGPWGRPDMALWLFTDAIVQGRPIRVFNQGNMSRDFTYIDDIVAGVIACIENENLEPYEIFNLGNHQSEALMDMIGLIEQTLGKTAEKIMMPMQDGDVADTYADITLAQSKLGFRPLTRISTGIPRFIDWFMRHPEFHSQT